MKLILLIIYTTTILIIYSTYHVKKNKKKIIWAILLLRVCLPIICIGFYGQILLFLFTLFDCKNGKSYASPEMVCKTGINYIAHAPFTSLAISLLIIISYITNTLYYRTLFIRSKSDVLKKTNSLNDVILFLTKTLIIVIFSNDKETESDHWPIIFLLMIITGFNAYINIKFKNKLNIKIMQLNIILSLLLFLGYVTLFIVKLLMFIGFDGGFYFYIFWIVYIFLFIIFYKKNQIKFIVNDFKNINNSNEYIKYIMQYYRMILTKNNSINNFTILKSYLETIEENCINNECPIKIYVKELEKGIEYEYLLYQYIDILFRYGISKFKDNVMLKSSYAMFLVSKMNNKKQALFIINSINEEFLSFNRNYNIYRCKKIINNTSSNENNLHLNYKRNINDFKQLILELTRFYSQFWTLLYESKYKNKDNFKDIFEIGSKIMKLRKKLEDIYQLLIETKTNNIEIFKLYSEYIKNILKDEERLGKNQNSNSIYSESFINEEKDYLNYNMKIFKNNDLTNYLLISGMKKDLGIILDCSISTSKSFGYTKEEIIGNHINILIQIFLYQIYFILTIILYFLRNLKKIILIYLIIYFVEKNIILM